MSSPRQPSPTPEVDLDPAAEHLARHVSTGTSTALAATQHAMQSATLRAYLARDAASAEARSAQRALRAQQQIERAAAVTDRVAARAGLTFDTAPAAETPGNPPSEPPNEPRARSGQWTAYRDGDPTAALGGTGVSVPPQQVLAHTSTQPTVATPGASSSQLAQTPTTAPSTAPAPGIER